MLPPREMRSIKTAGASDFCLPRWTCGGHGASGVVRGAVEDPWRSAKAPVLQLVYNMARVRSLETCALKSSSMRTTSLFLFRLVTEKKRSSSDMILADEKGLSDKVFPDRLPPRLAVYRLDDGEC